MYQEGIEYQGGRVNEGRKLELLTSEGHFIFSDRELLVS